MVVPSTSSATFAPRTPPSTTRLPREMCKPIVPAMELGNCRTRQARRRTPPSALPASRQPASHASHAPLLDRGLRPLASTSFQTRRACCALALAIELGNTLTRLSHSHRHSAPATSQQLSTQD
ncbi:hypothetical protein EXIGLDRAFT_829757, partial [Exidia glandulosa HHB12029]